MTAPERFTGSPGEWDRFVEGQHGWTHFHRYGWQSIFADSFGHESIPLATRDAAGALSGVLPLVRVKSLLFGHYLMSQPFVNYGGPLGSPEAVRSLAGAASELARAGDVRLLELRSRVELPIDLPVSHRKITVVLDLPPGGPEALSKSLGSKLRSQIKRPQKEGVEVRLGDDQLQPFYQVFSRHMRDLGTPTLPLEFFQRIARVFGPSVWFGCAWYQGQPIACGAGFRWADEFEMTWASALSDYNRISPNMLLYWAFMERAATDGLTLFNFGRCTPDQGTHRFKKQWGSRDEPLWWYQQGKGDAPGTPSPDQGLYNYGVKAWKRLPLAIANVLGPRIVRGIP